MLGAASGWRERLGARPARELAREALWVHAASMGEIAAAGRLMDLLRERGHRVTVSTTTVTGQILMRATRPDVPCHLAPLDHRWCAGRALDALRPRALVLVETELWPFWIAAADRRGIPVVVVSGRLSDRSFGRYRAVRPLSARTLRRLRAIGARSGEDAERFRALGAPAERVSVVGDLKLDRRSPGPLAPDLARVLPKAPLVVAGSTHPGEEAAALDALDAAERAGFAPALALAPRHPQRAAEVEALVRERGRPLRRRTALGEAKLAPGEVLVVDTVGELSPLFAAADVCFVGGTLAPIGGHNLLEPVFAEREVLFGPHTEKARPAAALVTAAGAGQRVADAAELARAVVETLRDRERARVRGAQGRAELLRHGGAAERSAALVERALATA